MKKIYYLLYLIAAVTIAACSHEEEDLFGNSSASRADAAVEADLKVLTDAENGWIMEYYPESQQKYGGYNVLVKFNADGKVEVASELFEATDVATSLFSVKQSAGVMLSFDTYNKIFHFFSDPSDPAGAGGNGYGLEGDFEFLILEANADKVLLKGKKTGNLAELTPLKTEWSSFIADIQNADETMSNKQYRLQISGKEIPVLMSNHTLTFNYEKDGNAISKVAAYLVTKTGYKFYTPIDIDGTTLEGFIYDAGTDSFTSTTHTDVKMVKYFAPINEQFVEGNWYLSYSALSDAFKPYFMKAAQGSAAEGEEILYMYLGKAADGTYSFNFRSGGYVGYLVYSFALTNEDEVTLSFALTGDSNGSYYYANCDYKYITSAIGSPNGFTYKLTTDDIKNPTYITMTNTDNPNFSMTVYPKMISYPFRN